ncbi:hypothetical protein RCL1_005988 [Eukaryota sp. TZLM3-RCL]
MSTPTDKPTMEQPPATEQSSEPQVTTEAPPGTTPTPSPQPQTIEEPIPTPSESEVEPIQKEQPAEEEGEGKSKSKSRKKVKKIITKRILKNPDGTESAQVVSTEVVPRTEESELKKSETTEQQPSPKEEPKKARAVRRTKTETKPEKEERKTKSSTRESPAPKKKRTSEEEEADETEHTVSYSEPPANAEFCFVPYPKKHYAAFILDKSPRGHRGDYFIQFVGYTGSNKGYVPKDKVLPFETEVFSELKSKNLLATGKGMNIIKSQFKKLGYDLTGL